MPTLCPNITFPHQQDFFPIRSVTKSSTARFSHENLVEKFKIFVQDFVPIRTALSVGEKFTVILYSNIIRHAGKSLDRVYTQGGYKFRISAEWYTVAYVESDKK